MENTEIILKENSYMLDTSAFNYLALHEKELNILIKSIALGFMYFSTSIQDMELRGKGARTYDKNCESNGFVSQELVEKFMQIKKLLNIKNVSEYAIAMKDHAKVDGTQRFVANNGIPHDVYVRICEKNNSESNSPYAHSHDAVIAESSIYHGCVLVSEDRKLRKEINKYVIHGAITTEELIKRIRAKEK